jgi:hypothetical protein
VHGPASFSQHLRSIGLYAEHLAEHPQDAGEELAEADDCGPAGQLGLSL